MPQQVERQVKVREIKVGDEVLFPGKSHAEIVADRDVKVKWATFSTDYGKHRIEVDTMVTVYRIEPTPEEREQERKDAMIWQLERSIAQAPEALAAAREKMIAELDSKFTSHWAYEQFIAAKHKASLWARVAKVWELAQKPEHAEKAIEEGEEPFENLIDAYKYVKRDVYRRALEFYTPTSRSTSVVSNAIEDIQRGVELEFGREDRWF